MRPASLNGRGSSGERILFFPDQHLGRNTAFKMGMPLDQMVVWDPYEFDGGLGRRRSTRRKVLLWKGHCSVHDALHRAANRAGPRAASRRERDRASRVPWDVVQAADDSGSTEFILKQVRDSAPGSIWAVGTEVHLVNRLAHEVAPEKTVISLDQLGCLCSTMFRVSPNHLLWILEGLIEGRVQNQIEVPDAQQHWVRVALDRMLDSGLGSQGYSTYRQETTDGSSVAFVAL